MKPPLPLIPRRFSEDMIVQRGQSENQNYNLGRSAVIIQKMVRPSIRLRCELRCRSGASSPKISRPDSSLGWSTVFPERVRDIVLPGYTVFSNRDAQLAARGMLARGPIRVKKPLSGKRAPISASSPAADTGGAHTPRSGACPAE